MATLEDAIYSHTIADAGLSPLIGTRVYPITLPQMPTYPCIVYRIVSHVPVEAMGVVSTVRNKRVEFQIHSNAADAYNQVRNVGEDLKTCWERYSGTIGSAVILDVFLLAESDLYDDAAQVYRRIVDFNFITQA